MARATTTTTDSNAPIPNDADSEAKAQAQVRQANAHVDADGNVVIVIPAAYATLPGVVSKSGKTRVTVQANTKVGAFTVNLTAYTKL